MSINNEFNEFIKELKKVSLRNKYGEFGQLVATPMEMERLLNNLTNYQRKIIEKGEMLPNGDYKLEQNIKRIINKFIQTYNVYYNNKKIKEKDKDTINKILNFSEDEIYNPQSKIHEIYDIWNNYDRYELVGEIMARNHLKDEYIIKNKKELYNIYEEIESILKPIYEKTHIITINYNEKDYKYNEIKEIPKLIKNENEKIISNEIIKERNEINTINEAITYRNTLFRRYKRIKEELDYILENYNPYMQRTKQEIEEELNLINNKIKKEQKYYPKAYKLKKPKKPKEDN